MCHGLFLGLVWSSVKMCCGLLCVFLLGCVEVCCAGPCCSNVVFTSNQVWLHYFMEIHVVSCFISYSALFYLLLFHVILMCYVVMYGAFLCCVMDCCHNAFVLCSFVSF